MTRLVAADIGGTHARFAVAEVADGRVVSLGEAAVLRVADHAGLADAWRAFAARVGQPLPRAAGIALACPVGGEVLRPTNSSWVIRPALIPALLGIDRLTLVNDFGAVGHAVACVGAGHLRHLGGPAGALPETGVVGIVGPGTGLGVAQVRLEGGDYRIGESEGGHAGFAPRDAVDDAISARMRARLGRVSVERIVSGSGLAEIHAVLAARDGRAVPERDERALWAAALAGEDALAAAALDRFCAILGAFAGDVALIQGAGAMVIAGGLGLRIGDRLPGSGFERSFVAKGRFAAKMAQMPVKLLVHPQPGLYGAAAAFAREHG